MRTIRQRDWFYITYAFGILIGTLIANVLSDAYVERAGIFQIYYQAANRSIQNNWRDVTGTLTMQRGVLFLLLNLAVHNKKETIWISFFGGVYGMSLALMSALAVRINNVWGFFFILIHCFPQMVCYMAAWFVLQNGLSGYRFGIISSKMLCMIVTLLLFYMGIFYEVFLSGILSGLLL